MGGMTVPQSTPTTVVDPDVDEAGSTWRVDAGSGEAMVSMVTPPPFGVHGT